LEGVGTNWSAGFFRVDQREKRELSRVYNQIRVKIRLLFG
jgi:hypothetical protein